MLSDAAVVMSTTDLKKLRILPSLFARLFKLG
jgi:hypothetical protein